MSDRDTTAPVDEDTSPADDAMAMKDEALGQFGEPDPAVKVPRDGGDNADATRDGGPDPDSPSRTGAGSVPQSGQSENNG